VAKVVFVSHASADAKVALRIVELLEIRGLGCWIAPRDVAPGQSFGEEIIQAIEDTQVTVLILSEAANVSIHVRNEVERATSKGKTVIPLRIREVLPSRKLELFIANAQWIDAWRPPLEQWIDRLAAAITSLSPGSSGTRPPAHMPLHTRTRLIATASIILATLALIIGGWRVLWVIRSSPTHAPSPAKLSVMAPVPNALTSPAPFRVTYIDLQGRAIDFLLRGKLATSWEQMLDHGPSVVKNSVLDELLALQRDFSSRPLGLDPWYDMSIEYGPSDHRGRVPYSNISLADSTDVARFGGILKVGATTGPIEGTESTYSLPYAYIELRRNSLEFFLSSIESEPQNWTAVVHPANGISSRVSVSRSEERRVGKECRSRWSPYH